MKTMTSSCDRTRLKDRILSNVAKAIKCIQESQILKTDDCALVLTNADWQCHKLCEHLDHVFLHGLRHVTHGYWKVVTEFTRKGVVQEILRLSHVTTDLGRGRAWLYVALNENLIESYMRCFMENTRFVKKYYVKEALVLDQQRLNVLVTLTSGLDYGTFKLEYNMPYLDLSSYQARPKSDQSAAKNDDDKVSLCSMESSSSQVSSLLSTSVMSSSDYMHLRGYSDDPTGENLVRRRTYSASTDSGYQVDTGNTSQPARHLSMPTEASSTNRTPSPFSDPASRISRIEGIVNVSESEEAESLEIIHVTSKGENSKRRKKKSKKSIPKEKSDSIARSDSDLTESRDNSTVSSQTTPSEDCLSDVFVNGDVSKETTNTPCSPTQGDLKMSVHKDDSGYGICEETYSNIDDTDHVMSSSLILQSHIAQSVDKFVQDVQSVREPERQILEQSDKKQSHETKIDSHHHSDHKTHNKKHKIKKHSRMDDSVDSHDNGLGNHGDIMDAHSNKIGSHDNGIGSHDSVSNCAISSNVKEEEQIKQTEISSKENDTVGSIYDNSAPLPKSRSNTKEEILKTEVSNQEDQKLCEEQNHSTETTDNVNVEEVTKELKDLSVKVDNNTLLHLMLDVFEQEDEDFVKMFCTRSGHTEGEASVIFVLITNKAMYLLRQKKVNNTYEKEGSIPYKELDYISIGVDNQVVQIICTKRRKQFWLTVGDSELTRSIVKSISDAIDNSEQNLPKLTVLSDATTQKIAMRKYAAKETQTDPQDVTVLLYCLVHWQDPSSRHNQTQSAYKEGHLLYRNRGHDHSWKTTYVSLRDGVLCLFHSKSDSKPHYFVKLNTQNCAGCRRMQPTERNHSFEVMGIHGNSLQLAAKDAQEANIWLQVLCQAVSEGQQVLGAGNPTLSCLPCCLVLTPQKILMCHEDVQTNFFRTLGSANVEDVTAITEDPFLKTYSVLEFESQDAGISSEQWVLYFNAANERTVFIEAFSKVWAEQFMVEVPQPEIHDIPLQTKCREMANYLRDSLLL